MRSFQALPICLVLVLLSGFDASSGSEEVEHHLAHRVRSHKAGRRHRAANDGRLRFDPEPYSRKLELNSTGKIHCKVAGGVSPTVQWFLNVNDPLPEGVTSSNGTLLVTSAMRHHAGNYTCRAAAANQTIVAEITLDIVVSPRILEPPQNWQRTAFVGETVTLNCVAVGEPRPTTQWDRNRTQLTTQPGVDVEGGANASSARLVILNNGSLIVRSAQQSDSDRYGCLAGSAAGLARHELVLTVLAEGELPPSESTGVGGKAVVVSVSVAVAYMLLVLALMLYCRRRRLARRQRDHARKVGGKAVVVSVSVAVAYMLLVLALMLYCRRRRLARRQRGEKMELEMAEGREKLVEEGQEDKQKIGNGAPVNGRLLAADRDSDAINSEVSAVSRASKKSGHYDHLTVPRSLLIDQIPLGRGEFGEVLLAKIDMNQVKKLKNKDLPDSEPDLQHVLVKALTAKDENQLAEFRRQLDLFSCVRHENVAKLIGLCNEALPHYMLLGHTDWGDLKNFLIATRTPEENSEYLSKAGPAHPPLSCARSSSPLSSQHRVRLSAQLAAAAGVISAKRAAHRDIAARNCVISSSLQLKLSYPALTRGPNSYEYYKHHDQVIPLRWLPSEAVLEGDYSTKSDVYMFAATVWEIYTKAELPFTKLNDNSVLERLKNGTLEWTIPKDVPETLAELLKRCWSKSPADRPHFTTICDELIAILQDVTSENVSRKSHDLEKDE